MKDAIRMHAVFCLPRVVPIELAMWLAGTTRDDSIRRFAQTAFLAVIVALLNATAPAAPNESYRLPDDPRCVIPIMDSWRHSTGESVGAEAIDFDDHSWIAVNLPHSYNATDGADGGGYYRGTAWYRKSIVVPRELDGKRIWLQFEGVSFAADVYIDGVHVGPQHRGGFSTFNYDVTSHLSPGSHLVAVKVDNSRALEREMPPQAGDYTKAGGIYRDVHLIAVDPVHVALQEYLADTDHGIASPGVYWTTTDVSRDSAIVSVKVKLDNQSATPRTIDVIASVTGGDPAAVNWRQTSVCTLGAGELEHICDQSGTIDRPRVWNGRIDPFCYDADVEIRDHESGELLDAVHQRLGIRSFVVDPKRGFVLNGKPYPLRGANAHQDELAKSWARSDADLKRDIDLMLEMGATVVRTSHYPANQAFYDFADETGLVVYTEVAINSTTSGGKVPAGTEFLNAARDQMRELIRQNYNHPSIAMWGLYNEIGSGRAATALIANLQSLTKEEERTLGSLDSTAEPMRRTTGATWGKFDRLASITDTVGFNRYFGWYIAKPVEESLAGELDELHRERPAALLGIAEYGGGGNIKQHEQRDPARFAVAPDDTANQQWHSETRQSWIHEEWWKALKSRDYLCYRLVWQMFDSACDGRNEGSQPGINDKGLVTADRSTKKDAFYFYKANWNDITRQWANEPTINIADRRWTERTTDLVEVRTYTNLENPSISLNGKPLGNMSSLGTNTYVIEVTLAQGDNVIKVIASHDGRKHSDRVVWSYRPNVADASAPIKKTTQAGDWCAH